MDAQVGRILDKLKQLGLAENTIVVFTSDHGYHLGEHGLWQKMSLFEQSARVPLIISAPGTSLQGKTSTAPVGLIDLYPTLTALCDVPAPKNLQGQDLSAMLSNPKLPGRGWALCQVTRGRRGKKKVFGYSIRTPQYRYTEWDQGKQGRELYDHKNDPLEQTNLAASDQHQALIAKLSKKLQSATKDSFPASGKTPKIRPGIWAPNLTNP